MTFLETTLKPTFNLDVISNLFSLNCQIKSELFQHILIKLNVSSICFLVDAPKTTD